jgi:hypothetical protein
MTANVAGTWTGFMGQGGFSSDILYELQQDGTKVSGRANAAAGGGGWVYLEGTVEGDTFTYRQARGACCGRLTVKGDEMTGYATTGYPIQIRRMK